MNLRSPAKSAPQQPARSSPCLPEALAEGRHVWLRWRRGRSFSSFSCWFFLGGKAENEYGVSFFQFRLRRRAGGSRDLEGSNMRVYGIQGLLGDWGLQGFRHITSECAKSLLLNAWAKAAKLRARRSALDFKDPVVDTLHQDLALIALFRNVQQLRGVQQHSRCARATPKRAESRGQRTSRVSWGSATCSCELTVFCLDSVSPLWGCVEEGVGDLWPAIAPYSTQALQDTEHTSGCQRMMNSVSDAIAVELPNQGSPRLLFDRLGYDWIGSCWWLLGVSRSYSDSAVRLSFKISSHARTM